MKLLLQRASFSQLRACYCYSKSIDEYHDNYRMQEIIFGICIQSKDIQVKSENKVTKISKGPGKLQRYLARRATTRFSGDIVPG
jgi:hypothetical protein